MLRTKEKKKKKNKKTRTKKKKKKERPLRVRHPEKQPGDVIIRSSPPEVGNYLRCGASIKAKGGVKSPVHREGGGISGQCDVISHSLIHANTHTSLSPSHTRLLFTDTEDFRPVGSLSFTHVSVCLSGICQKSDQD